MFYRFSNPRVVASDLFSFLSVLFEAPHFCLATLPPTQTPGDKDDRDRKTIILVDNLHKI